MSTQLPLFDPEEEQARSLLDQLLEDSRLYTRSRDYLELLEFVVRLRNFAPFNAMLLQVQKPGLRYAASAYDWRERFGRTIKEGARPLLILWPFGPVALVYDVMDTEGNPLPKDVNPFIAQGSMTTDRINKFLSKARSKRIEPVFFDWGDGYAGHIKVIEQARSPKQYSRYQLCLNRCHGPNVQFATLAHELGHLYSGHLGPDKRLNIPKPRALTHVQRELEAESVAYLVCARNGVKSRSQTYLTDYVDKNTAIDQIDLYQVMRAAGQVESLLGLTAHTRFEPIKKGVQ